MADNDSPSVPPALTHNDVLQAVTTLCNELDELMLLHECYYQAAEELLSNKCTRRSIQRRPLQRGLSVFPQWLRQRDTQVLEAVHQLQESLRTRT